MYLRQYVRTCMYVLAQIKFRHDAKRILAPGVCA